jgi:hypothetical protein
LTTGGGKRLKELVSYQPWILTFSTTKPFADQIDAIGQFTTHLCKTLPCRQIGGVAAIGGAAIVQAW